MVLILIAEWEIVIAGLAVIIAGLTITISCHEPNFTVGSGEMTADSGFAPAVPGILSVGAILVGVMRDGMGMGAVTEAIVRVATAQIIAAAGCNCL